MKNKLSEKKQQSNKKEPPHLRILDSTLLRSAELSPAAFRVYIMLRFRRNRKTGRCNPSVPTIARDTGLSKATIERALNELESLGWILRKSGKGQTSNEYRFAPEDVQTTSETVAANAHMAAKKALEPVRDEETDEEYLKRKRLEFPHLDVPKIWADFLSKCGSKQYPKMKPTRNKFDQWLATEYEPMQLQELPVTNPNKAMPQWRREIENCQLCNDKGYIVDKKGYSSVCTHTQSIKTKLTWRDAVDKCSLCNENGLVHINGKWRDCDHKGLSRPKFLH